MFKKGVYQSGVTELGVEQEVVERCVAILAESNLATDPEVAVRDEGGVQLADVDLLKSI
jgi:hypothetical protein